MHRHARQPKQELLLDLCQSVCTQLAQKCGHCLRRQVHPHQRTAESDEEIYNGQGLSFQIRAHCHARPCRPAWRRRQNGVWVSGEGPVGNKDAIVGRWILGLSCPGLELLALLLLALTLLLFPVLSALLLQFALLLLLLGAELLPFLFSGLLLALPLFKLGAQLLTLLNASAGSWRRTLLLLCSLSEQFRAQLPSQLRNSGNSGTRARDRPL